MNDDVMKIVSTCEKLLPLRKAKPSDSYRYSSLSFCVIDAIFSNNVCYTTVINVIKRYCRYYKIKWLYQTDKASFSWQEHTISQLIHNIENVGVTYFAENIISNTQRTSPTNGILKVEAVLKWAKILQQYKIETLQDFNIHYSEQLGNTLKKIPGQKSGKTVIYLRMLAGNKNLTRPCRHNMNFLSQCTGRDIEEREVQGLLEQAVKELKPKYSTLCVGLLDNIIWKHMSWHD